MACVNVDGTLTTSARRILEATRTPATLAEIAQRTHIPLFRIRGSIRELVESGFVTEQEEAYLLTLQGSEKIG